MPTTSALPDPAHQAEFYNSIPAKRFFAWIIDVALVTCLTFIVGLFTLGIGWLLFPIFFIGLDFGYRWLSLRAGSATLGMRLMAVEIRNSAGQRLDSGEAALHTLTYMICTAFLFPLVISILMTVFGPRKQGLHDLFLGTAAINRPR